MLCPRGAGTPKRLVENPRSARNYRECSGPAAARHILRDIDRKRLFFRFFQPGTVRIVPSRSRGLLRAASPVRNRRGRNMPVRQTARRPADARSVRILMLGAHATRTAAATWGCGSGGRRTHCSENVPDRTMNAGLSFRTTARVAPRLARSRTASPRYRSDILRFRHLLFVTRFSCPDYVCCASRIKPSQTGTHPAAMQTATPALRSKNKPTPWTYLRR